MSGRERDQRHSWIVSRKTGEPTGYEPDQLHPELRANVHVIDARQELEEWLAGVGATA